MQNFFFEHTKDSKAGWNSNNIEHFYLDDERYRKVEKRTGKHRAGTSISYSVGSINVPSRAYGRRITEKVEQFQKIYEKIEPESWRNYEMIMTGS